MGWFNWLKGAARTDRADVVERLEQAVRTHVSSADEATVRTVAAVAGLLAALAYADQEFGESEAASIRATLTRTSGLDGVGADAVLAVLREIAAEARSVHVTRFARTLRDELDREGRRAVLDLLVDLSAADGTILTAETNFMRRITDGLGLSQADYNDSQSRHRDKLAVLSQTPK
jgi:uncharacterized tellurite resistance protein B-like protein